MRKLILVGAAVLGLALTTSGCTHIRSAAGGNSGMANDAWFTQTTGLGPFLVFSSKVYYCPPMGSGGASTCTEAEMIESGQPAAPAGGGMAEPAPAAGAVDEGGMDEGGMDEGGYE